MKKQLNLEEWVRKDHFHLFRQFDEPFFGVCVNIDCTKAYQVAREKSVSFFLYYLHCSLVAANETEPFRYRIHEDQVWIYDEVHASPTLNRPDGTFGFGYLDYYNDFQEFLIKASPKIEQVRNSKGLIPAASGPGQNFIHYSSIPWIDFTSLSHARSFSFKDSCPKISFGKMTEHEGKRSMPVSIHVHHALIDGFDVGQFIERFQQLLNQV